MTIQDQINALPPNGGKIVLPAGDFTAEPPLVVNRDWVIFEGQGWSTTLPYIVGGISTRREGIVLRDIAIDGKCDTGVNKYAIDFRNVCCVKIDNVLVRNCRYGLVMDYAAYYAVVESLFIDRKSVV